MPEVIFSIAIVVFFVLITFAVVFGDLVAYKWNTRKEVKTGLDGLSEVSKKVIEKYNSLPEDSRAFGDITHILRALDVKYGVEALDRHFMEHYGYSFERFRWRCSCPTGAPCKYPEFHDLNNEINSIKRAKKEQEYRLQLAGVEGDLSEANALLQQLRIESQLIETVTKELT